MSTETENLHRMSAPDPTVAGVSVGGETIFSDESGVFLIPAEHAPTLAEQGWATLPEPEDVPEEPKGSFTEDEVREQLGFAPDAEAIVAGANVTEGDPDALKDGKLPEGATVKPTRTRAKKAAE